jgi:3'-phosphoadenosine 5'-phosphosulfate sulfotransferase (PAPS reductase)/FAD synthetase
MSQEIQLPPDDLIRRTRGDVAFVVNFSGGKDSMRMLGRVRELYPNHPIFVVMADTGFEHVRPISAEDWSREQVARFALPLSVVRNPNKTYLQMVERRGMFPSSTTRQCTSDLKRGPIEKFVRALSQKVIVNCTGIRSEESSQRSKQIPWKANKSLSVAGRSVWDWMPIFDESLGKVLSWHWCWLQCYAATLQSYAATRRRHRCKAVPATRFTGIPPPVSDDFRQSARS